MKKGLNQGNKVDVLETVMLRNAFYKDNFRRLFLIFLVSVILNIVLFFAVVDGAFHKTRAIYFVAANNGKLVYSQPVNKAVLKDSEILAWVNQTMPKLFSMDFMNYRRELLQTHENFTPYGWRQFIKAIGPILKLMKKEKYVVHARPSDVPFIMSKGVVNGIYTWQIQVPLSIIYASAGQQELEKNVTWTAIVQRVRSNKQNQELGIAQIVQTK